MNRPYRSSLGRRFVPLLFLWSGAIACIGAPASLRSYVGKPPGNIQSYLPIAYVPISLQLVTLSRAHHVRITAICAHHQPSAPTVQRPTCCNIASQRINNKHSLSVIQRRRQREPDPLQKNWPPSATARNGILPVPSYAYSVGTVVFDMNNHKAN